METHDDRFRGGRQHDIGFRDVPDAEKPIDKRAIDLSDAQIDQVLFLWDKRQSAFALDFVERVWGPDGKLHVKQ